MVSVVEMVEPLMDRSKCAQVAYVRLKIRRLAKEEKQKEKGRSVHLIIISWRLGICLVTMKERVNKLQSKT